MLPIIIIDPFSSLAVIGNPLSSAEHLEDLYNWQNHHRVSEFLTAFTTLALGNWASKKNRFYIDAEAFVIVVAVAKVQKSA